MPALLIRTSGCSSTASSASRSTSFRSPRSATRPATAPTLLRTESTFAGLRPCTMTSQPRARSNSAVRRPMPSVEPVMRTVVIPSSCVGLPGRANADRCLWTALVVGLAEAGVHPDHGADGGEQPDPQRAVGESPDHHSHGHAGSDPESESSTVEGVHVARLSAGHRARVRNVGDTQIGAFLPEPERTARIRTFMPAVDVRTLYQVRPLCLPSNFTGSDHFRFLSCSQATTNFPLAGIR